MVDTFSYPEELYVLIGIVAKAQGLHGEVAIRAFSDQPENFADYPTLRLVDKEGTLSPELKVETLRIHKGKATIKFDRVTDRGFAEKVVGMGVLVARELLPEPDEDEFYYQDLIEKTVITTDGTVVGKVKSLFSTGAQDVLVVDSGGSELLIPVTSEIVRITDEQELVIDPPPGLLDINREDS